MDPAGGGSPLVGLSRTSETFQPIASYSDLKCASPSVTSTPSLTRYRFAQGCKEQSAPK